MARKKPKFTSPKITRSRKNKIKKRLILYSVFTFSLILGLSFLSKADFLTINEISISGNQEIKSEDLIKIAEEKTDGNILGLFSRNNIFLFPRKDIVLAIIESFHRVSEARVSLDNFSIMEISVKEREPVGLWCEGSLERGSGNKNEKCFYLDSNSFIFAEASINLQNFTFYYGEVSGNPPGSHYLPAPHFIKLSNFLNLLSSGFSVEIKEVHKRIDDLNIFLENGTLIIINIEDDLNLVWENLFTLVSEPEFQKQGRYFEAFEKIDLRFGNKIPYKLRENPSEF